ncbi:MAG TPA: Uma2 family endonuclease [Gemmataceae bacterium]|nr:Uma2 family endonuclease [Gemmataceae bacterium]
MTTSEPQPVRWTRDEYFRLCEAGYFSDRRVELIGGDIIEMPAQYDLHLAGIDLTANALQAAVGSGFWVRRQGTLDLSPHGVPDPDVAVVPGGPSGARRTVPTSALLVVEVSDSSLIFDRTRKGSLYAAAGLADYWIVNLVQRQLEVCRNPAADAAQPFGFAYASRTILDPGDAAAPLAAPNAQVAVADLLP